MQYYDVEKLRSKNTHLKSIIWEHYRIFKQNLLQLQTDNENIRNQIFDEKQRHTEIVEHYSKKISLLEAELRNIRNYTPKMSQRKKINIRDPRWKLDELEEEQKYLWQEAELIFERAQDPKELLKKAHEKIFTTQKKKPVRLDTDDSSSSCSNLFEKFDTLIMTSDETVKNEDDNDYLLNEQKNMNINDKLSKNTNSDQSQIRNQQKEVNEEKFVSQNSTLSSNSNESYSFRFDFENDKGKNAVELDEIKLQESFQKEEPNEIKKEDMEKTEKEITDNQQSDNEYEHDEIFEFSQSDDPNKNSNSYSYTYSPQINNDYDNNDNISSSKENLNVKNEESMHESVEENKNQSHSNEEQIKDNESSNEIIDDENQNVEEEEEELSSKEMTDYFKLTNTDSRDNTQKIENADSIESNGEYEEGEKEENIENENSRINASEQNQFNDIDDQPERKRVEYNRDENISQNSYSSDAVQEEFILSQVNDGYEEDINVNNISQSSQKNKQNSSITIGSQSNIKNDSLYFRVDVSPLHINDSSTNDNINFESPNDNDVRPNLKLSPTANSQAGDSLSIGEESSDDGFSGRFSDSDMVGYIYS